MGRGGKVGCKPNSKRRFRSKDKGSDDSDEDYVVSNEKDVVSDDSEDCGSFLDGCASEESFGNFVEEEEGVGEDYKDDDDDDDDEVVEVEKVAKWKPRDLSPPPKKTGGRVSHKRKRALNDDHDDEEEDDEDYDVNDDEEDEDEEFALDEDDCLDEEEEFRVPRKMHSKKVGKQSLKNRGHVKGRKRRKKSNSVVLKKPLQKKGKRSRRLRRKGKSDDSGDCSTSMYQKPVVSEKSKKVPGRGRRRHIVQSDSDLVSSRSSDFEYTISEEEREQIREASELCRDMADNLRSSTSSRKLGDSFLGQLKWPPRRKGKEKLEEVRIELAKQICGICLTEEDKRRVQGTLDCCSHYFCFTCIMAWSKVETRCPLCKQRFHSISKPARSTDLRAVVVQVPERDQVYQPSEEEIRGYFDPYENVLCTECHQGGDDALMLLCDSCDSPAHTYCVGLGQEVPEGNWYCEGCRPIALGSSSLQPQGLPDQNMANNFSNSIREGIDLNSLPSPTTTSGLGFGSFSSPRHLVGDGRGASSPIGGGGAPTLSGRRWVHRQIQNLLALNRTGFISGRGDLLSPVSSSRGSFSSQINLGEETSFQPTRTGPPSSTIYEERFPNNPSPLGQNVDIFSLRLNHLRRQAIQNFDVAGTERTANRTLWDGFAGTNSFPGFGQPYNYSSRPSIGSNDGVSSSIVREEQVQSVVKSHLQNFSKEFGLDNMTLEDIARKSTHTILAACGLEHMVTEVCVQLQPFNCPHLEIVAAGQTSLMKGCCPSCFDSFGRDVVKNILNTRLPQWLIGTRL